MFGVGLKLLFCAELMLWSSLLSAKDYCRPVFLNLRNFKMYGLKPIDLKVAEIWETVD